MMIHVLNNSRFFARRVKTTGLWVMVPLIILILQACVPAEVREEKAEAPVVQEKAMQVSVSPSIENRFNQAVKLLQQKETEEATNKAIELLNSVITEEKRLPAPYVNRAIAYLRKNENKLAEENLISALKLEIGHPIANNELGLLYRKAGRFKAARVAYENALRAHPDYLPARINLGVLCDLYMHDFTCALEQYEQYLAYRPDDKNVTIWVADVKQRLASK